MDHWIVGVLLSLLTGAFGGILVVVGLPGTWLVCLVALGFAFWTGFSILGWPSLIVMFALALTGEWLEFWLGAAAAAKVRSSWKVSAAVLIGGLCGAVVGAPFLFGLGALIGSLIGSFTGAAVAAFWEGASVREMIQVGRAAMKGRWQAFLAKMGVVLLLTLVFIGGVLW
ncbi:hypothetical protein HRbin30_03242 [bacterium HR30]|nr:hypothetical protein HRbin30_03242 [bacterium HR30]